MSCSAFVVAVVVVVAAAAASLNDSIESNDADDVIPEILFSLDTIFDYVQALLSCCLALHLV